MDSFAVNLLFAFIVGGVWITLVTVAAERFGSKIGGFIGGLPSTMVVAFLFIGLNQSPAVAAQATNGFLLSVAFSGLFLVSFALLADRGFGVAFVASLLLWASLVSSLVVFGIENFALSAVGYVSILVASFVIFEKRLKLPSAGRLRMRYTHLQIAGRALLSGLIVALAVFMSKVGGPVFGGIFSPFPAVYMSTLFITNRTGGLAFARSVTKPLFFSGMLTGASYGLALRYFYVAYGLVLGTVLSYAVSMIVAYFVFLFIRGLE
ncbi:MAG: DUF3147 family protein [Candidatus Aenigmatarchaeota archaeon]|nr:MAG: DUF3147 family protein [Candidatus Aenigmarchaeota archaeon]